MVADHMWCIVAVVVLSAPSYTKSLHYSDDNTWRRHQLRTGNIWVNALPPTWDRERYPLRPVDGRLHWSRRQRQLAQMKLSATFRLSEIIHQQRGTYLSTKFKIKSDVHILSVLIFYRENRDEGNLVETTFFKNRYSLSMPWICNYNFGAIFL